MVFFTEFHHKHTKYYILYHFVCLFRTIKKDFTNTRKKLDWYYKHIRYDQKMKDLCSMFTPFIVPEGGKALDAEKVEDKDKVLEQITNVDENCVKVCE